MTTEKQIGANRTNALKSTGPRTIEGKQVVRKNAVQHGLLSKFALLSNEKVADFQTFSESIKVELNPMGAFEVILVERIVTILWKLRRIQNVEAGIYESEDLYEEIMRFKNTELQKLGNKFLNREHSFLNLSRYETAIEKSLFKNLHELQRLQAVRSGHVVPPPLAIDVHSIG